MTQREIFNLSILRIQELKQGTSSFSDSITQKKLSALLRAATEDELRGALNNLIGWASVRCTINE